MQVTTQRNSTEGAIISAIDLLILYPEDDSVRQV